MAVCAMLRLYLVLLILFTEAASKDKYCSISDRDINCILCSNQCTVGSEECKYTCPKHCGKSNTCLTVCGSGCRNGICEYLNDQTVLVCSDGCIAGLTGQRCQEPCPSRCYECDQFNDACITTTLPNPNTYPTTRRRECVKTCNFCKIIDLVYEQCTSCIECQDKCICNGTIYFGNGNRPASTSSQSSGNAYNQTATTKIPYGPTEAGSTVFRNKIYEVGIFGALSLTLFICIVFLCYKCHQRYHLKYKCVSWDPVQNDRSTSQGSRGSLPGIHGYDYIDDNNLLASYSRPNENEVHVLCSPADNYYEKVGNQNTSTDENTESVSSLSSVSETLFGNLFDGSGEEYEMKAFNYLTPSKV